MDTISDFLKKVQVAFFVADSTFPEVFAKSVYGSECVEGEFNYVEVNWGCVCYDFQSKGGCVISEWSKGEESSSLDRSEVFVLAFLLGTVSPKMTAKGKFGSDYASVGPFC